MHLVIVFTDGYGGDGIILRKDRKGDLDIHVLQQCRSLQESSVAEMISAMAAGWDAKLIVETWSKGGAIEASIGLAIASQYTGGRHVCIVSDQESKAEYAEVMGKAGKFPEVIVGHEAKEAMEELQGIDFMVVDSRRNDFARIFRAAKLGDRGAVLIRKNASLRAAAASEFRWWGVLNGKSRIVRSVFLPVGKGLDIAHVGAVSVVGNSVLNEKKKKIERRWIKHIDPKSGEEFVIRK